MNKLTQKQESFALDVYKGLSETKAYQNHYNTTNMSIEAVYVEACRLKANPKVALRIEELNKPIIKKIQASKEAKLEKLEEIFSREPLPETVTARERIFAIAEHNKMAGDYMPDKVDITSGLEVLLRRLQGRKELSEGEE